MSVLPFLLNLADGLSDFGGDICDDYGDFGFGILHPQEIRRVQRSPRLYLPYHQPRLRRSHSPYTLVRRSRGADKLQLSEDLSPVGKDGFQVCMDVAQFKPNELTVKTVDNTVIVEGKHEEREDEHGFISRQFIRKYSLPKGYDPKEVVSTLSSDGILTLKAPPPPGKGQKGKKERLVQIQQTGPAHLSIKDNPKEGGEQQQKQQQQQQQNGEADEKMQD